MTDWKSFNHANCLSVGVDTESVSRKLCDTWFRCAWCQRAFPTSRFWIRWNFPAKQSHLVSMVSEQRLEELPRQKWDASGARLFLEKQALAACEKLGSRDEINDDRSWGKRKVLKQLFSCSSSCWRHPRFSLMNHFSGLESFFCRSSNEELRCSL